MTIHPLEIFCKGNVAEENPFCTEDVTESCCWRVLKGGFQTSRRYSVVATQVAILVLDVLFLVSKVVTNSPPGLGEMSLLGLSFIGVVSLHYLVDMIWKRVQDSYLSWKVANYPILLLATAETVQATSNAALTAGNFYAAVQGAVGHPEEQKSAYQNMILWGEISIATGLILSLATIIVTVVTRLDLGKNPLRNSHKISASIHYSMDKDTAEDLRNKLKHVNPQDVVRLDRVLNVVKKNMGTQITITMGGKVFLIFVGAALEAVERYYTPNSLVSAIINVSVASIYAIRITCEKGLEICQRKQIKDRVEEIDILNFDFSSESGKETKTQRGLVNSHSDSDFD